MFPRTNKTVYPQHKSLQMAELPKVAVVFDYRGRSTPTKPGSIHIRIYHNKELYYIPVGVSVLPREWNKSTCQVENRLDMLELNERIAIVLRDAQDYINTSIKRGGFSIAAMRVHKKHSEDKSFLDYIAARIADRGLRPNTVKNHTSSLRVLTEFGRIVNFSDLSYEKIIEYDAWLHERYTSQVSIHTHHKILKVYINDAIRGGIITDNPYSRFSVSRGKSEKRRYLTDDEVTRLRDAVIKRKTFDQVRDLFLFQCYTGLAYADLCRFDFKDAVSRNGKYVILDRRVKTGEDYYLVLLDPAVEILKKYKWKLPTLTNQQYNLRIKVVADMVGLGKNLTSHMARHTFAVFAINHGVPIETLAKMMGHTDVKTTQQYAKIINSTVEAAYDSLNASFKG